MRFYILTGSVAILTLCAGLLVFLPACQRTTSLIPTACAQSWHHLHPMPEKHTVIPLNITYSKKDFDTIKCGLIPKQMEDKWLIYVTQDHIYMHRSWTGHLIYDCSYTATPKGIRITQCAINRDPTQYTATSDVQDMYMINTLLNYISPNGYWHKKEMIQIRPILKKTP